MRVFVTGGAGFIGSYVCETLLHYGAEVVAFDDFSSGHTRIDGATIIEGDVRNFDAVRSAMSDCTHIAHLAALASVPASITNPSLSEAINLQGTLNVIEAAHQVGIKRIVFSSTAAIYGDATDMPVTELTTTNCQSPYAEDKLAAEVAVLHSGIEAISLRYFNVHGPRQDPNGAYAAVIPTFIQMLMNGKSPTIFGTGEATRDFVSVSDVAALNLIALTTDNEEALGQVYNVASGSTMSVMELFTTLRNLLGEKDPSIATVEPIIAPSREGDILHSSASIEKARKLLGFNPETDPRRALSATVEAYWAQRD
ncbi:MAG: NAD-dependent epimerase/dehydratase family protein [Candidatus Thalassarchaeaceae archaeon]|nr:NAD-dependent epimerase/dehydratase family protein [Candidatus Thalassarchaeaceae archaeon]